MTKQILKKGIRPLEMKNIITETENVLQKHYTPITMAKLKKTGNIKCWQRYKATGALIHGWQECNMARTLWESSGNVLQS